MKNYYEHIKYKYGLQVCKNLKQYSNSQRSLASQKQNLKFLIICRKTGLIPNHLKNSTRSTKQILSNKESLQIYDKIELKFHQKVLNIEISEIYHKIKRTNNAIRLHDQRIKENLSENEYKQFINKQKQVHREIYNKIQQSNTQKIDTLKSLLWKEFNIQIHKKWFENRTDIQFPLEIKWLLSLGKKFTLPVDKHSFPLFQLIADGEEVIRGIQDERQQEQTRAQYSNMLHSFIRHQKNDRFAKYVLYVNKLTINFLKQHKDIVIVPADKGNVTVAMKRIDYEEKMHELLSDRNTYRTIRNNPTTTLQTRNNDLVKWLKNNNYIDDREKAKMTTYTAQLPSIYGLPKIHKADMPLRPITSSMNVPCYELSKYVGKILQCVTTKSSHSVKNSFEFVEKAKNVKLSQNDVLVSFDAVSLFTNIPIQLAINIVKKKWCLISKKTNMAQHKFLEILDFCLKENNYLQYQDVIYKQIFGMPMGNPLSPTIADLVLDYVLDECLTNMEEKPVFMSKYVDDIFAIMDKRNIEKVLKTLNGFHPKIQFTVENEHNKTIPFLDVKIHREENGLLFDWYQKPTASGRLINFRSNQARHIIINTASNLVNKIFKISDVRFHATNEKKVTKILSDNGYPFIIIRSLLLKQKMQIQPKNNAEEPTNTYHKSIVYVPTLSDNFKKSISKNLTDVRLAFKSNKTLDHCFTKLKTKPDKDKRTDVIYKINCNGKTNEPCNLCYIGTTKQLLRQRISNHKSDIKLKNSEKTALASHSIENGHSPNFEGVEILQTEKHVSKRYTLETLHILNNKNNMNRKQDTQNISAVYCSLLSS